MISEDDVLDDQLAPMRYIRKCGKCTRPFKTWSRYQTTCYLCGKKQIRQQRERETDMADNERKPGSGFLFVRENREKEWMSQWSGDIMLPDGTLHFIDAWTRKKDGSKMQTRDGGKMIRLQIGAEKAGSKPRPKPEPEKEPAPQDDFDDDIPF